MRIRYETILPLYRLMWKHWRKRRYERFVKLVAADGVGHLLDVGGLSGEWMDRGASVREVDVLNLIAGPQVTCTPGSPVIRCISGDGTALNLADKSYDVVYSNSVIEHVGDAASQAAFAREVSRVGKGLWIQTPAHECPLEPHYLGLFLHWFPESWRWPLARWTTFVGLTGAATDDGLRNIIRNTRLLRKKEFVALFPDCEIWVERILWIIPKSYVAYRR